MLITNANTRKLARVIGGKFRLLTKARGLEFGRANAVRLGKDERGLFVSKRKATRMNKLDKLKEKYSNAQYEPLSDCAKCSGEGEIFFEGKFLTGWKPCMCIYVEPEMLEMARSAMRQVAADIRAKNL